MKTIIVPIDFSDHSIKGLELALVFAKVMKANIDMVYVQKKTGEYFPNIKDQQLKWAEKKFKEIQKEYACGMPKRNKLDFIIKHGKVYQEIINQAHSYKDSIIVTSTHGISGWDDIFLGSNATKIIAHTTKTVITFNNGEVPFSINKILLPLDHSVDTRQKVPATIELAKVFKAEIIVAPVISSKNDEKKAKIQSYADQVCKRLTKEKIQHKTKMLCGKSLSETIVKYAETAKVDIISIMSEQNPGITSLLLGNHAEIILTQSKVPVMITTPKDIFLASESFRTQGS
ncbi:MAG: hypothetical protein A2275_18065 [Bacteroidetes bacterium RIFOXYA12_FULL_35_11]|nr:MAG: hypothetical protein A2X01_04790 [Bacteroidetes bacterium GWF2_35_48]OFY72498.1 MAG: hypothetical protein A2275_18065 [Bacteroidetes bacterium RIFOXYA12_FULL_35_11]OFY96511.1 MAG: hypothetical protein A2309_09185 [Bacteroidetes bacterium RIFOXYB2_FULL_35_7]OFZ06243.1 MAG: hypothetical protein A2491_13470 [Bacteroidetes bacterium RIFOXYC12_FULL_35_7]HBX51975.1 hypothetical protein [Bacteroidales bacterium]